MPTSLDDLIALKNGLSRQLLRPEARRLMSTVPRRVRRVAEAVALAGQNVHAVGVGAKLTGGVATGELCVRLYVFRKLPKNLIAPVFRLPATFDGVPTDVIESPAAVLYSARRRPKGQKPISVASGARFRGRATGDVAAATVPAATSLDVAALGDPKGVFRPLRGGVSGANADVYIGTLGCVCRSTDPADAASARYVLSCYHVLADPSATPPETRVCQPSVGHNGSPFDSYVADFRRGYSLSEGTDNRMDAAIAEVRSGIDCMPEIRGIGLLTSIDRVTTKHTSVRKSGGTSGLRWGIVTDLSVNTDIPLDPHNHPNVTVPIVDQLRIESAPGDPAFAEEGDSGSIVALADSPVGVGLLVAGDGEHGEHQPFALASHLDTVFERLRIAIPIP